MNYIYRQVFIGQKTTTFNITCISHWLICEPGYVRYTHNVQGISSAWSLILLLYIMVYTKKQHQHPTLHIACDYVSCDCFCCSRLDCRRYKDTITFVKVAACQMSILYSNLEHLTWVRLDLVTGTFCFVVYRSSCFVIYFMN